MSKTKAKGSSTTGSVTEPDIPNFDANVEMPSEDGGLGYSDNPEDSIWCGEDFDLQPGEWIDEHLGRRHPLENILEAIIVAHPNRDRENEVRLEDALQALVNWPRKRGPKLTKWPELIQIASDYWVESDCGTQAVNLTAIIRKRMGEELEEEECDHWREAFGRHRDELLRLVTGQISEEQAERRRIERQVLVSLWKLGAIKDAPNQG